MNKFLKLLVLSSGAFACLSPMALKDNAIFDSLNIAQESVQTNLPAHSYSLNIDIASTDTAEQSNDADVSSITNDEQSVISESDEDQTLDTINQDLQEASTEYEDLKECLMNAINDISAKLQQYKNNEIELSNEEKLILQEQSNSIKYLAEILEDLNEELICVIGGCEEDSKASIDEYMRAINILEQHMILLQNTLNSLPQSLGWQYSARFIPPYLMHHDYIPSDDTADINKNNVENAEDGVLQVEDQEENSDNESSTNSNANIGEDDKPTTFGLKSNIDTYAPTKRNIDTFFNTALYNNEYMYGNMPYGYGGGYGMPYGNGGFYGNPYGMNGLNSNLINRAEMERETSAMPENNLQIETTTDESEEAETDKIEHKKPKPHLKRAKNIDTYQQVTVKSNINTMSESKISQFFKQKFGEFKSKVQERKNQKSQPKFAENSQDAFENKKQSSFERNDLDQSIIQLDNITDNVLYNETSNDMAKEDKEIKAK